MKIEIEISEQEIYNTFADKVKATIVEMVTSYRMASYIEEKIRQNLKEAIDACINDTLQNSALIRQQVALEFEKKVRAQLAVAIRKAKVTDEC